MIKKSEILDLSIEVKTTSTLFFIISTDADEPFLVASSNIASRSSKALWKGDEIYCDQ